MDILDATSDDHKNVWAVCAASLLCVELCCVFLCNFFLGPVVIFQLFPGTYLCESQFEFMSRLRKRKFHMDQSWSPGIFHGDPIELGWKKTWKSGAKALWSTKNWNYENTSPSAKKCILGGGYRGVKNTCLVLSFLASPGRKKIQKRKWGGGFYFCHYPLPTRLDTFSLLSLFLGKFGKPRDPGSLIHFTWLLFNVS